MGMSSRGSREAAQQGHRAWQRRDRSAGPVNHRGQREAGGADRGEIVGEFLELVKAVTWRSRLSFLQTQEGAMAPLVVLFFLVAAAVTGDKFLIGEVLMILPFHLLA
ncbi:unnamed protein product, partial [Effrenium voratum]